MRLPKARLGWLLILLLPLSLFIIGQYYAGHPDAAEWYASRIFPVLTALPKTLVGVLPFSLTEVIVILILPLLFIVGSIRLICRLYVHLRGRAVKSFKPGRALRFCLVLASVGYSVYLLNFGFCYSRQPLGVSLNLEEKARSREELIALGEAIVGKLKLLSPRVERDAQGRFKLPDERKPSDYFAILSDTYQLRAQKENNEVLERATRFGKVRPKAVSPVISHLWSYTGVTGMYVPFVVESSVNSDTNPDEQLFTALHEIAHNYGFAREDEANFLAFYCGSQSADYAVQYAVSLMAYTYVNNALYEADRDAFNALYGSLPEGCRIDLAARNMYWRQFEGPVQDVSEVLNDTYLKVNRQVDGVKSYGRVVDLLLAYFSAGGGRLD